MAKIAFISADTENGLVYVGIGDKPKEERKGICARTDRPHPCVNLDFDEQGNLVGVEIF
jgi:hypothetical protein